MLITRSNTLNFLPLPSLPYQRPLLMIGHGTRDLQGRQAFLDFAKIYQSLDASRPVVPCFLELTQPSIQEGINYCLTQGYTELSVLPVLLFAARHNKFDVTNELDRSRALHPQLKFNYGRPIGITPEILALWQERLLELDTTQNNPKGVSRSETVLLVVGRGSSDPDANSDVYKLARLLWEGSGYLTVETCFVGITHPRLEEGFRRARLYQPKRIIVLPYFLFTGALVKKIFNITAQQQEQYPEITTVCLPEIGVHPHLLKAIRERELEIQLGQVQMNCEICKFRLAAVKGDNHPHHNHDHGHHHHDYHADADSYADLEQYHHRIWQTP